MEDRYKIIVMKPKDHVAVALTDIPAGATVQVACEEQILEFTVKDAIRFGHKVAIKPIKAGEDVLKYEEVIGIAIRDISVGEHVHIHNIEGKRGRGDKVGSTQ